MYKFQKEDAVRFAHEVGIRAREIRGELVFKQCPYCRSNTDDKNKFAINLDTGQFNCFRASCGARGNMLTLAKDFNFSLGNDADEYYFHWRKFVKLENKKPESTDPAVQYMASRGIPEDIVRKYRITTEKDKPQNIVFPFYDEKDTLQFIKFRNSEHKKGDKGSKEWCKADCKPILFGMNLCDMDNKTLIITEGQIDSLSCVVAGFQNAVSVPLGCNGFTWVPECWDWVNQFKEIIVFGDYEKGKMSLLSDIISRFSEINVKAVRFEDYLDCKDANDILRKYGVDQVKKCIENATTAPNKFILSLSDVKRDRISDMRSFPSGMKPVDKLLGGLYFGRLYEITGKSGLGKSTFASQLMLAAVKARHKCFIYSGELSNGNVQEWIEFQLAGDSNINVINTDTGFKRYSVSGAAEPLIRDWYRDYITIAADGEDLEGEEQDILKTIEQAIVRYEAEVILIDNLMTAIDDDFGSDQYQQQTKFVKALKQLTRKFNVSIFLVVHPRKNNGFNDSNDDIAGSSNIVNLADVLFRLFPEKAEDKKEIVSDNRVLKITKNRIDGRVTSDAGYMLHYQRTSRRYSTMQDKFDWLYGWEQTDFTETEGDELPFD